MGLLRVWRCTWGWGVFTCSRLSTLPNFFLGKVREGGYFKRMQSGDLRSLACVCAGVYFVLRGKKKNREKGEKEKVFLISMNLLLVASSAGILFIKGRGKG